MGFAAFGGAVVVAIPAAAPDHGAGPQGEQMKAASLCIFDVSVPLRGHHAFSALQWPFKYGTYSESSRYTMVPSGNETDGPDPRL